MTLFEVFMNIGNFQFFLLGLMLYVNKLFFQCKTLKKLSYDLTKITRISI